MNKTFNLLLGLTFLAFGSYAQSFRTSIDNFHIGYEVAVPSGFITRPSWLGVRMDYRRMVQPNFSVGLATSWNSFSEHIDETTYEKPNGEGAVTADMVRGIYSVPITLTSHFYLKPEAKVVPYIGLGLGAQYSDQTVYVNEFNLDQKNWGFVVRPEVGLIMPTEFGGVYLSATYNYATNHNDDFKIDHLKHFAFSLGFVFGSPTE